MTTALTRASEIYAKIENPMAAVAELGKLFHQSSIMGVNTPGDGAVLALTCMCEGITPLEFAKTYHIIKGKPSMRADMMAAKFKGSGGKIDWHNLGDDGKAAEATFSFDGQSHKIAYTIDDARNVIGKDDKGNDRIDAPDSNWRKDRGAMLRARLITKAIRILAPEIIAGVYTPEELEDAGVTQEKPAKKSQAERRKELEAESAAVVVVPDPPVESFPPVVTDEVIDATPENQEASETPPFETQPAATVDDSGEPVTNELLQELLKLGTKFPSQKNPGEAMKAAEVAEGICRACKVERPQAATRGQARKIVEKWRTALGVK